LIKITGCSRWTVFLQLLAVSALLQACVPRRGEALHPAVNHPAQSSALLASTGESVSRPQEPEGKAPPTTGAAVTPIASKLVAAGPAIALYRGRTDTNAVALTFDAGADAGYAQLILDVLRSNGVRATFGMTGQWAQTHPDLVRQMALDGHQLMNHTWDHQSFTGVSTKTAALDRAKRQSELERAEAAVRDITGASMSPYFRAPFGDRDGSVENDAGRLGYAYDVLWTVDTGGWAGAPVARIIATSARGAEPGAIIVMHVGSASLDGPALQGVIDAVRAKGLGFATVSEIAPPR
jgi:peptidoglycan-N-acetylglucosamine deacetylase